MLKYSLLVLMLLGALNLIGQSNSVFKDADIDKFVSSLKVDEPNKEYPVKMNVGVFPENGTKEGKLLLVHKIKIAPDWHIYAYDPSGMFIQTEIGINLPKGVKKGKLLRKPKKYGYEADPQILIYKDEVVFVYELSVGASVKGKQTFKLEMHYQCCDPYMCMPPQDQSKEVILEIK